MTIHVNIGEAKTRFSELCAAALRGEEVIVQNAGVPKLRLVALPEAVAVDRTARRARIDARLAAMDKIPKRRDAFDPIAWDENGLPI
jgi:antitoxin (DNA-binding transcriptional repressor) of toxin-antitoxin stability system